MSFIQQKLYPRLPLILQNAAISAFGYAWQKRRFGGEYERAYEGFIERERYTAQQWKEYQQQQLKHILLHAFKHVPYYRQLFEQHAINEQWINDFSLDKIHQIPFLDKDTLRQKGTTDLLADMREPKGSFFSSSGSTGTPTKILYSHAMHQRLSALYEARIRRWAGVSRFDARGMIGGRRILPDAVAKGPFYRYNYFEKQTYFSAYHISPTTVADYVEGMHKHRVQYMVGYAMANYILAKHIKEAGLVAPKMKAVLTSSEKLTPTMRQLLSEVYQCKVYDGWSGVEWCGLISENEHGQLLISPDSAYIEILKPDGSPAQPGEEGELVCTGFLNYDQPLVRYKIGDMVKLAEDQHTKCGRAFTIVEEIIGRTEDVVVGKDGREMVRFHGIFIDLPNVVKGQVVQEKLDSFTVNVATNGLTAAERSTIIGRMQSQLGDVAVAVNEMPDIPVGANGKFKAVISKVKQVG